MMSSSTPGDCPVRDSKGKSIAGGAVILGDDMTRRAFTPERDREVARLYIDGWQSTELAKRYGVSTNAVLGALRREGVEIRGYPKAFTEVQQVDIVTRYKAGEPVLSVAASYEYEQTTAIYRVLHRNGIEIHGQNGLTAEKEIEIVNRFQDGEIVTDLATEYDASLHTVRHLIDQAGLEREERRSKYQLDIHTFDEIDNEGKAYVLGFIYADGGINGNRLRIQLKESDAKILASIRDVLKSNAPIRKIEGQLSLGTNGIARMYDKAFHTRVYGWRRKPYPIQK